MYVGEKGDLCLNAKCLLPQFNEHATIHEVDKLLISSNGRLLGEQPMRDSSLDPPCIISSKLQSFTSSNISHQTLKTTSFAW
jgi:hypothetical protein